MNNENDVKPSTDSTAETVTTIPTTEKPSTEKTQTATLFSTIASQVSGLGPAVRERVIATAVEAKLIERAQLVQKALEKIDAASKELSKKLGPDVEQYTDGSDKPIRFFSKERKEARQKAETAKKKLETVLETVLSDKTDKGEDITQDHWNKLAEAVK